MDGVGGICVVLLVGCLGRDESICDSSMSDAFDLFVLELIFNGLDAFVEDCFSLFDLFLNGSCNGLGWGGVFIGNGCESLVS